MKKESEQKTIRKGRMGIGTNRMSDEVYNLLSSKAQSNQLSKYIIELVEKDINNRYILEREQLINEKMDDLERKIDTMDRLLTRTKEKLENVTNQSASKYETTQEQKAEHSVDNLNQLVEQVQQGLLLLNRQSLLFLSSAVRIVESWYSIKPRSEKSS